MKTARIINCAAAVALAPDFKIPKDGLFHLARKGEFPGVAELADGTELRVIQVIDDTAVASMANAFRAHKEAGGADLLVDRDHLSGNPANETIAEGWIQNVVDRSGDLYAGIRLSGQGRHDIESGNYRYISGVWDIAPIDGADFTEGCRVRPVRLTEAGLTNRPNISGLAALSNRGHAPSNLLPDDPANSSRRAGGHPNKEKPMKQIASKLGLSADASEDAILSELAKVMNRATTAEAELKPTKEKLATVENRLKELEESSADAELDAAGIAADHADRAVIRTALIQNRDGGRAMLKLIAKPAPVKGAPATMTNRATARVPGATPAAATVKNRDQQQRELINKFKAPGRTNEAAYHMAKDEAPELFAPEVKAA